MKHFKTEICFEGEHLVFKRKYFKTKEGKKLFWEYIERRNQYGHPIIIFALTKEKEVILEKIYRFPFEDYVLELPAGLQDKEGESEIEVAERELLEETGYRARKLIKIFQGPMDPGQSTEEGIYYFAKDVVFEKKPAHEDAEDIKVIKIPVSKLVDFVEKLSKKMKVDSKILSILSILQKKNLI